MGLHFFNFGGNKEFSYPFKISKYNKKALKYAEHITIQL